MSLLDTIVSFTIELVFFNLITLKNHAKHYETHGADFDNINVYYIFLRTVSITKKQCCVA